MHVVSIEKKLKNAKLLLRVERLNNHFDYFKIHFDVDYLTAVPTDSSTKLLPPNESMQLIIIM